MAPAGPTDETVASQVLQDGESEGLRLGVGVKWSLTPATPAGATMPHAASN